MKVVIESNDIDELYGSDIEKPDMYILLSLKFYILCVIVIFYVSIYKKQ